MADEVLDQWDILDDAGELFDALSDGFLVAGDHGGHIDGSGLPIFVVPGVPGRPIEPGARISGMKVARIDDMVGIYLFAEVAD